MTHAGRLQREGSIQVTLGVGLWGSPDVATERFGELTMDCLVS